jgi:hypothetical protein
MAISLYDTEEVTPVQTIDEIKREKKKEKPEVVSKVRNAKAPPTMGEAFQTFMGDIGAKPAYDTASNALAVVKDYLTNPIQYKDGGEQDYTNIDFGATAPRLAADAALAYGGAKGVQYGANKFFPPPGVEVQINQRKDALEQAKRLASGNLNPIERADLEYKKAKTQQLLSSLNPQTPAIPQGNIAPPAQPLAPTVAPTIVPVPTTPTTAPIIPSIQQRSIGQTDAEKAAIEDMKMKATELPGSIQAKYGTTPTKASEMVMFANQASPEMKAGFAPALIDMMNKGKIVNQSDANVVAKAQEAGVTPSISAPEAQTLVTTKANAETPVEKIADATKIPESSVLRTGSGMAAIQGIAPPGTPLRKDLASIGSVPSTHAFVPGGQLMDIIRNSVGQDAYTASLAKYGFPSDQKEAHAISRQINESMGRLNRDVAKDLNIGLGEPTKAITQKVAGGKTVKLAGTAGALILMTDLANAKTPQEKREAMRNLGEAILPPSMTSTEAGAPTLPPSAYTESRKLGSPFYKMFKEGIAPPMR